MRQLTEELVMAHAKNWEEVKRETVYKKYSQTIQRRDFRLPDGKLDDFYIRVEPAATCALAFTAGGQVVTVPQFRPGPMRVMRELPGGQLDEGEDPRETAARELLEETGYAGELDDWIGTWQNDAYTEANRTIVIIRNCKKIAVPKLDYNEFGEVELVDIADFVVQVRTGELSNTAGAMLALDHLGLLK